MPRRPVPSAALASIARARGETRPLPPAPWDAMPVPDAGVLVARLDARGRLASSVVERVCDRRAPGSEAELLALLVPGPDAAAPGLGPLSVGVRGLLRQRIRRLAADQQGRWNALTEAVAGSPDETHSLRVVPYRTALRRWAAAHAAAGQLEAVREQLRSAPWTSATFWSQVVWALPSETFDPPLLDTVLSHMTPEGSGVTGPHSCSLWRALASRQTWTPDQRAQIVSTYWQRALAAASWTSRAGAAVHEMSTDARWYAVPAFAQGLQCLRAWSLAPARGRTRPPVPDPVWRPAAGASPGRARVVPTPALPPVMARRLLLHLLRVIAAPMPAGFWPGLVQAIDQLPAAAGRALAREVVADAVWCAEQLANARHLDAPGALALLAARPTPRVRTSLSQHVTLGRVPAVRVALQAQGRSQVVWRALAESSTDPVELSALLCHLAPLQPGYVARALASAPPGTTLPAGTMAQLLQATRDRSERVELVRQLGVTGVSRAPAPPLPPRARASRRRPRPAGAS